jgi:catalase
MYDILGRHPACRAGHAKGAFCRGVFIPSGDAAELTDAPHMRDPLEVTVRFSNVTGDPDKHDGSGNAHGMAVRFHLAGEGHADLIAVSLPCFTNRLPSDFVEMNYSCFKHKGGRTRKRLLGTLGYALRHHESLKAMWASVRMKPIPSYANGRYNSLNAFTWTKRGRGADDAYGCYVRYSWIPVEGQRAISKREAKRRARDFLQQDLDERLGRTPRRPIRFRLEVQLASADDKDKGRVEDPTRVWPTKPARIVPASKDENHGPPVSKDGMRARFLTVGVLELTDLVEGPATGDRALGFDPLHLTEGIESSGDRILEFRPQVYELAARERALASNDESS